MSHHSRSHTVCADCVIAAQKIWENGRLPDAQSRWIFILLHVVGDLPELWGLHSTLDQLHGRVPMPDPESLDPQGAPLRSGVPRVVPPPTVWYNIISMDAPRVARVPPIPGVPTVLLPARPSRTFAVPSLPTFSRAPASPASNAPPPRAPTGTTFNAPPPPPPRAPTGTTFNAPPPPRAPTGSTSNVRQFTATGGPAAANLPPPPIPTPPRGPGDSAGGFDRYRGASASRQSSGSTSTSSQPYVTPQRISTITEIIRLERERIELFRCGSQLLCNVSELFYRGLFTQYTHTFHQSTMAPAYLSALLMLPGALFRMVADHCDHVRRSLVVVGDLRRH